LNPRRKYWLALPPPECWVAMKPGIDLEQLADALDRAVLEVDLADLPLRRRLRDADKVRRAPGDDDLGSGS
jgi:hypothetical protein